MSFQFKQFSVEDELCAMKIGTDGCLLGAWTRTENTGHILDIGTGSGVIAMMLAQRCNAMICAVEIDEEAFIQAEKNFSQSPWRNRLNAFHSTFQEFVKVCQIKYDLIVCCPPYFLNSMKAPDRKRRLARHTDSLSFEELISGTLRILKPDGRFCTIIPPISKKHFCEISLIEGYHTVRITEVEPKKESAPVRILLEMRRDKIPCIKDKISILEKDGKSFTEEYRKLTGDFYLNF